MATNKFIYCFELGKSCVFNIIYIIIRVLISILETAGVFFGWTGLFTSSFAAMFFTVLFFLQLHNIARFRFDNEIYNSMPQYHVFIILVIFVLQYVFFIIKFWVSKSLLDGTKSRQSKLVKRWYDFHVTTTFLLCIAIIGFPQLIICLIVGKNLIVDKHLI